MAFFKKIGKALASPVAGIATSLLGAGLGAWQQSRNIKKTNEANLELAEFQFQKDLEMWHRQNAYNTPAAQMQRFEDAGLNKHMIFGQGTPGNATNMPSFNAPQLDYRGTQNVAAQTLSSALSTSGQILSLQRQKEDVEQAQIQTWVDENLAEYVVDQGKSESFRAEQAYQTEFWRAKYTMWNSRIEQIKYDFWKDGLSPSDATWLRLGAKALMDTDIQVPRYILQLFDDLPDKLKKSLNYLSTDTNSVLKYTKWPEHFERLNKMLYGKNKKKGN